MTEQYDRFDPAFREAEYWDGHNPEDECSGHPGIEILPLSQSKGTEKFARATLAYYLRTSDQTPIKVLEQGQTFHPAQYHPGTIIKFEKEELNLQPPRPFRMLGYERKEYWGVVCVYRKDDREIRTIVSYLIDLSSAESIYPNPLPIVGTPMITVGAVRHKKLGDGGERSEAMWRYRSLSIHHPGKPIAERSSSRLPRFGTIFRNPLPEET